MADPRQHEQRRPDPRVSGIAAAALEGAREGEDEETSEKHPDANAAAMARPAPGLTDQSQGNPDSSQTAR
jgi:hypothetical protein